MITKIISTLSIMLLLASAPLIKASPHSNINFKVFDFTNDLSFFDNSSKGPQEWLMKKSVALDESKDPSRRRGTENWEEPQSSFFILPGVVLGIIALAWFFNRD